MSEVPVREPVVDVLLLLDLGLGRRRRRRQLQQQQQRRRRHHHGQEGGGGGLHPGSLEEVAFITIRLPDHQWWRFSWNINTLHEGFCTLGANLHALSRCLSTKFLHGSEGLLEVRCWLGKACKEVTGLTSCVSVQ